MNRSPLLLTNDVRFCVSGTVTIHPTAAIATNVVLRANPGSCLVIGAGVVVGKGCVLQSYGGSLVVEDGVTLGSQVLLIGQGIVRKNACIGSLSTLMASIAVMEGAMIPANSLVGAPEPQFDQSRATDEGGIPVVENDTPEAQNQKPDPDNTDQPDSIENGDNEQPASIDDEDKETNSVNEGKGPDLVEEQPSALPHPDSHRMFMPINTPRYSGGAVDDVNEGRELGKSSSSSTEPESSQNLGHKSSEASSPSSTSSPTGSVGERSPSSTVEQSNEDGRPTEENAPADEKDDSIENANGSSGTNKPSAPSVIYGKSSVQRLMTMMFPYRTLNDSGDDKE